MSNEEYKEYIIEMIQKINNPEHLKRIFNYVHKFFIRRTGRYARFLLCKNTLQIFF